MKLFDRYGKKKVLMIISGSLVLVACFGLGIWYMNEQNHKKEVLASIDLIFKENAFIEYGQEKLDYNEYIKEKVGEPEFTLPTDEIDTKT